MMNNQSTFGVWDYAFDSGSDGIYDNRTGTTVVVGDTTFEIYGIAMKQTVDNVYFAINSNLPLTGQPDDRASNGVIAWGDLILNFNNALLNDANGNLFGIRFAPNPETPVIGSGNGTGIFDSATVTSVVNGNVPLRTIADIQDYNNFVRERGGIPTNGDLGADDPYFNQNEQIRNVIQSGNRLGDMTMLSPTDLQDLQFGTSGSQTFGFSVSKAFLPNGNFTMHLAPECGNDIIALTGTLFKPPSIDIEKKTNLIDVKTPEDAIALQPGTPIIWTYEVTNTGAVSFTFDQVKVTDDKVSSISFLSSSDVNQDRTLSPGEKWFYAASGVAERLSTVNSAVTKTVDLDFETDGAGNRLAAGTSIDDEYQAAYGLTISSIRLSNGTVDPNHKTMIFDTANPTGDEDLGTPNEAFGGPGRSKDGTSGDVGGNRQPLGNVLIISENNNPNDPDDKATGGIMRFDWQKPTEVNYIDILDVDKGDTRNKIRTYDENGNLIREYSVSPKGDNSYQRIQLGGELASRLEMIFDPSGDGTASGAIASIGFKQSTSIYKNVGTVTIDGLSGVTDSDASYYRNGEPVSCICPPRESSPTPESSAYPAPGNLDKPKFGPDWIPSQKDDLFRGGVERDIFRGRDGNDILIGRPGDDFLCGGSGQDTLRGDRGNDKLKGGSGRDILDGGAGRNHLWGGQGKDCFVLSEQGFNLIQDFQLGRDVIKIKSNLQLKDINVVQRGSNTLIQAEDQIFAVLKGVSLSSIALDSVISI